MYIRTPMLSARRALAAALTCALTPACFVSIDRSLIDAGPARDGGVADSEVDAGPCPTSMIEAPAGTFCIDTKEVTNAEYALFAADSAALANQPSFCQFNRDVIPDDGWPVATERNDHPVHGVDWCDANAYCAWIGRRLCTGDEWSAACTNDGERAFPYGASFEAARCNGEGALDTAPAGSFPNCTGGFSGLFDMTGNVEEWVDSCTDGMGASGANDPCQLKGGGAGSTSAQLACANVETDRRSRTSTRRGFRCCR